MSFRKISLWAAAVLLSACQNPFTPPGDLTALRPGQTLLRFQRDEQLSRTLIPQFDPSYLDRLVIVLTPQAGEVVEVILAPNAESYTADLSASPSWTVQAFFYAKPATPGVLDVNAPVAASEAFSAAPGANLPPLVLKPRMSGTASAHLEVRYPRNSLLRLWRLFSDPLPGAGPSAEVNPTWSHLSEQSRLTATWPAPAGESRLLRLYVIDQEEFSSAVQAQWALNPSLTQAEAELAAEAALQAGFPAGWKRAVTTVLRTFGNIQTSGGYNYQNDASLRSFWAYQSEWYLGLTPSFSPSVTEYTLDLRSPSTPMSLNFDASQASSLQARFDGGDWIPLAHTLGSDFLSLPGTLPSLPSLLELRVLSGDGSVEKMYRFTLVPRWPPVTLTVQSAAGSPAVNLADPYNQKFDFGVLTTAFQASLRADFSEGSLEYWNPGTFVWSPLTSGSATDLRVGGPSSADISIVYEFRWLPPGGDPEGDQQYFTARLGDFTPPPPVTGLTASPEGTGVRLSWTNPTGPDPADFTGLVIYNLSNFSYEYPGPSDTTWFIPNLSGLNQFWVKTVDASGNTSDPVFSDEIDLSGGEPVPVSIEVTFEAPGDETIDWTTSPDEVIVRGSTLELTTVTIYDFPEWWLDGSLLATTAALSLDTAPLALGNRHLTLVAWKDGLPYAKTFSFTLVQP